MVIGYILIILGILGIMPVSSTVINEVDYGRYTYTSPYTTHELSMMFCIVVFVAMIIGGCAVIFFCIAEKRNTDNLIRLQGESNKNVCPQCGINISQDTVFCPKCGMKIEREKKDVTNKD